MATTKNVGSQLNNFLTYTLYLNDNITLAKNVFLFKNMPKTVNLDYVNQKLLENGAVAFFIDKNEDLEDSLFCLPFTVKKKKVPYNEPFEIVVRGEGGYRKKLKENDFVIMYDNNACRPIMLDIMQYSERLALCTRVSDININNQKLARVWQVPENKIATYKSIINSIDSFEEQILGYEGLNLDSAMTNLVAVPYIADKVDMHKEKIYNEYLNFIGISTIRYTKKERMIEDEITNQIGGSIAKRFSRFEPRQKAIELVNEKFKDFLDKKIEVQYYDGIPKSNREEENEDVSNISNVSINDGV